MCIRDRLYLCEICYVVSIQPRLTHYISHISIMNPFKLLIDFHNLSLLDYILWSPAAVNLLLLNSCGETPTVSRAVSPTVSCSISTTVFLCCISNSCLVLYLQQFYRAVSRTETCSSLAQPWSEDLLHVPLKCLICLTYLYIYF